MFYDGLLKIRRYALLMLAFCGIMGFFMLLYFAMIKKAMIMVTSKICIADFLDTVGSGTFMNIMVVPLCTFFITTISELNCSNANYYLRNKSRKSMILKRLSKLLILSLIVAVLMVLISYIIAGVFTAEIFNWDNKDSYFFIEHQMFYNVNFLDVVLWTFAKLFFPICFFSFLGCALGLMMKKAFSFLIIVVVSGINLFGKIKLFLDVATNNYLGIDSCVSLPSAIVTFIIIPVLTIVIIPVAVKLIKRKDFLN